MALAEGDAERKEKLFGNYAIDIGGYIYKNLPLSPVVCSPIWV